MPGVDLRSAVGRRFRYLMASYELELGGDLGEAEQALLRQHVVLQLESERLQADAIRGVTVDRDLLVRLTSEARRSLGALRAKVAKRKQPAPTLRDRLQQRAAGRAEVVD
ncbi:hypothetical protein [Bradyrhizobium sp. Ec3.3]|uniref:hypothetical protein n=1 Tax=Bradyrhizobium sp. Ec3.3 TaxID=189753 RepID=UPI0012EB69E6|nr:hypothetical protein [Bradyrhizobium sp. Ec3.3]